MNETMLKNYAKLLVKMGVNMEKGQLVIISCDVSDAYFGRIVAQTAYECGAEEVAMLWGDENITRMTGLNAADHIFDEKPLWSKERYNYYDSRNACYINILSGDPDILKDVSPDRLKRSRIASGQNLKEHRERMMNDYNRWTIGSVPSKAWAAKMFPDLSSDEAFSRLWELIAACSRIDNDDPIAAWEKHNESFINRTKFLNDMQFKSLRYKNELGTDVEVGLPEGHIWFGGGTYAKDGRLFFPNIPTEEIFTLPMRSKVNGRIVSSMPLCYNGIVIEGIDLTLKDGRIVSHTAKTNAEHLANIINTDDGAHYLGEVALVPHDSPISNLNTLFYKTLFDENASCHFAIGKAYGTCVKGYDEMTPEQQLEAGINDSLTHIDFMVGTKDMSITGIGTDGAETQIFVDGNFVI